jgi:osmotically-inducible protein OsmY
MVALVSSPPQQRRQQELGRQVAAELHTVDARRFSRISVRGLLCGFVELDGVVSSFYAKSLALQIARNLPEVSGVVDLIRVVPTSGNRISST